MEMIDRDSPLRYTTVTAVLLLFCFQIPAQAGDKHAKRDRYQLTNLVSDGSPSDPNQRLVNPWGIAFNPNGPVWIANNGTGTSTLYDGNGAANANLPFINVPGASGAGNPTGIVFNSSNDFNVTPNNPARFIFANEGGTLAAWAPTVDLNNAVVVGGTTPDPEHPVYKGLALAGNGKNHYLYATDFHNAKVQVFDKSFQWVDPQATLGCSFSDPKIPAGFAPFGIQNISGVLYVTYAKQDADKEDDVAGPGLGYVDSFDANGCLIRRFAARGHLNAPWGIALAPANFGVHGDQLLIANFGDGTINAFDVREGHFRGPLLSQSGDKIAIDGLWGIAFGNGVLDQPTNTLFFTAGPYAETHGLYGKIKAGE